MRALAPWRPFREMSTLHRGIDDLFRTFFGPEEDWVPGPWRSAALPLMPVIESYVREGELVVRADLPGIDPKAVELAVENHRLVIRGERKTKEERTEKDYFFLEVAYGQFERALELPEGVDTDTSKASYHDGVLEIKMKAPKEL